MLTNNTFPLGYVAPSLLGEGGGEAPSTGARSSRFSLQY